MKHAHAISILNMEKTDWEKIMLSADKSIQEIGPNETDCNRYNYAAEKFNKIKQSIETLTQDQKINP